MVTVSGLTLHFGGRTLYDNISFQINKGDRIGLTGRNGAGKSTLLRILAKEQTPDGGSVQVPSMFTLGFLAQDLELKSELTVVEETYKAFEEVLHLEHKIAYLEEAIGATTEFDSEHYFKQLEDLSDAHDRFNIIGGYTYREDSEKILSGLGFKKSMFTQSLKELSGGWKMRVELAKIILQNPNLILLDEPTNHLDIESIMWLEDWLKNREGAVMIISHDRAFLDNVTNRTVEVENASLFDYKTNYTNYLLQREERREVLLNSFNNQQKEIQQTELLINKFRAKASKAKFAQSLINKLDRMDTIELDDENNSAMRIRFLPSPASGKVALEVKNVAKMYGEKSIFSGVSMEIERGQKIAFVGKNGEGKSTLSKLIAQDEQATEGEIILGHNVTIGYLAQNQPDMMDNTKTVLDTIEDDAPNEIRPFARSLLGAFLFKNDAVDKKVRVLSGGERSRLAMAKLLLRPFNLLILDEPTNHLDIRSKEVLKKALQDFVGTIIIVSHDREFLSGLCEKTFEFIDGNVKEYLGGIEYFLDKKKIDNMRSLEENYISKTKSENKPASSPAEIEATKLEQKEQKKKQHELKKLEEQIASAESKIKTVEEQLKDPEFFQKNVTNTELFDTYDANKKTLDVLMQQWLQLQD